GSSLECQVAPVFVTLKLSGEAESGSAGTQPHEQSPDRRSAAAHGPRGGPALSRGPQLSRRAADTAAMPRKSRGPGGRAPPRRPRARRPSHPALAPRPDVTERGGSQRRAGPPFARAWRPPSTYPTRAQLATALSLIPETGSAASLAGPLSGQIGQ